MSKTITFMDSFDNYSTADILKKWDLTGQTTAGSPNAIEPTNGRNGKGCLAFKSTFGCFVTKFIQPTDQVVVNLAFRIVTINAQELISLVSFDQWDYAHLNVMMTYDGRLAIYRGGNRNVLLDYGPYVKLNTWNHLQVKVKQSTTNGVSNGTLIITLNNRTIIYNTNAIVSRWDNDKPIVAVTLGSRWVGNYNYPNNLLFDDIVITETTDPITDDYVKDRAILTLYPVSSGTNNDFVGNDLDSVDNHLLVNETTLNTATYIKSNVSNAQQTFNFTTPVNVGKISAIKFSSMCKKDDGGERYLTPIVNNNSVITELSPFSSIAFDYLESQSLVLTNPITGLAWTPSDVNSLQFGLKIKDVA